MSKIEDPLFELATLAEPYRIKMVEKARLPSREERKRLLEEASNFVVHLNSEDVFIDLITDSGTGAMSDQQWAALMRGDEAYMRSRSFWELVKAVRDILGFQHVVPTHQGRAAEHIVMEVMPVRKDQFVLSNTHFDTTRAHVEHRGARPVDLLNEAALKDFDNKNVPPGVDINFKGNYDLNKLETALNHHRERIAFVMITVLNNFACSSPVSMENIKAVSKMARAKGLPVFFDACRFAENAYFIKTREKGYADKSIQDIVREMMSYGDGCWMSAKKDAIVNIGGFIAVNDRNFARKCQERLVLYEGFPSYGGLAGRDLEAMAIGLYEGIDESHLRHRTQQAAYLAQGLEKVGITTSKPSGGSGVFVDIRPLYTHLPEERFPAVAFTNDVYLEGGVRVGAYPFSFETIDSRGELQPQLFQFARFAIPRRTYTQTHLDYVVQVMAQVKEKSRHSKGYVCVYAPAVLPHFFSKFEPFGQTQSELLQRKAAAAAEAAAVAERVAQEAAEQAAAAKKAAAEAAEAASAAKAAVEKSVVAQAALEAQKTLSVELRTESKEAARRAVKAQEEAKAKASAAVVAAKGSKDALARMEAAETAAASKAAAAIAVAAGLVAAAEVDEAQGRAADAAKMADKVTESGGSK